MTGFFCEGLGLPTLVVRADEMRGERAEVKLRTLVEDISLGLFLVFRLPLRLLLEFILEKRAYITNIYRYEFLGSLIKLADLLREQSRALEDDFEIGLN